MTDKYETSERSIARRLPFPFGKHPLWVDGTTRVAEEREDDPQVWRQEVISIFDSNGFDFQVFLVAASGFLTDSYALFSTNVILPLLGFLYWPTRTDRMPELWINVSTLAGSAVGQLLFGWLTDRLGRRKLYGLELVLVIFATLGIAQASGGEHHSMSILSWIVFYRFFLGLGIGAEYPLSAVITAEFSSTRYRAKMMAAVFLMQPLGQILAAAVGWGVLSGLMHSRGLVDLPDHGSQFQSLSIHEQQRILSTLDSVWRWVVGVGCIPTLLAIVWRFSIPESPRYTMDVNHDPLQALAATRRQFQHQLHPVEDGENAQQNNGGGAFLSRRALISRPLPETDNPPELWDYLFNQGNIRYLLATAICWFLLDFCFYALGINSPRPLAALWDDSLPTIPNTTVLPIAPATVTIPITYVATVDGSLYTMVTSLAAGVPPPTATVTSYIAASNPSLRVPDFENIWDPQLTMFNQISHNAQQYIETISISSLAGSGLLIFLIDYVPRKMWLVWSFLILSVCFAVLGGVLVRTEFQGGHWAAVVIYAICQFFFNLGPNTLTYIISAEIFPTRFRATCHGISAACGKIGAIIILLITEKALPSNDTKALNQLLASFSVPLALAALFAWVWIPELQLAPTEPPRTLHLPKLPNKSLERLAKGWQYATGNHQTYNPSTGFQGGEDQRLGFRKRFSDLWYRMTKGGQRHELGQRTYPKLPTELMRPANSEGDIHTQAGVSMSS
ncbi:hypothetical protein DTO212C5_4835 [Paecilomyces variotii]|nr:hypothetical protein DTO212C5_4835 [Paecilomyces variotii]